MTIEDLARWIRQSLKPNHALNIDGLGTFARGRDSEEISFRGVNPPRIFIAYGKEDSAIADRLYRELEHLGFAAWLDRKKLLPGQNWRRRIEDAISNADFFIACFSTRSVKKRGGFQAEIRFALDCARRVPLDEVFLIPVRLDDCTVPMRIQREMQYVDLFPHWKDGLERVLAIIEAQLRKAA
jgi:hypothetical protein